MDEIQIDTSSDIHFLENEKFDFDLPFSPSTLPENKIEKKENDDHDEVFFGPVCFTEKCTSPEVTSVQEDTIKPLSPLSGEQVVEVFTEATKIALHFERLSTKTSDTSLNQSHASSGRSSLSNSYLKSNCSSSSSSVLQFSFEKLSSGSSDGKPSLSDMSDMDKENTQPVTNQGTKTHQASKKDDKGSTKIKDVSPLVSKQSNTPVVKNKRSLPKPAVRASRLPKSKNTEKSCSAFNSPIKEPDVAKTDNLKTSNLAKIKTQSIGKSTRKRSEHNIQKSVPVKTTSNTKEDRKKTSSTTLAKRNIFCSTESLTEDGTKQTKSCKLPVPEQSKIPEPRSRRRRSNSTSSISSQSSVSSQSSTPSSKSQASQDSVQIICTRKSKPVPSTKASLASSLPLPLVRRSAKTQENSNDKKLQPVKALPTSARNKTIQEPTQLPTRTMVPGDETKDDKIPLPSTPKLQTSLPVRQGFSLKRPSSNTRSKDSSPHPRNSCSALTTDSQTPRSKTEQTKKKDPSLAKRRSFLPTPGRNTQTTKISAQNISSDNQQLLTFSPAVNTKKKTSEESEKVENRDVTSPQSVDDLLQLDDAVILISNVVSLQPNPVQQFDLIDLSGI